ncbi:hypothetical protein G7046_g1049 [Stylonectria norvegica]|nr:hypothetical protein G7046_g1049 [Stylonectria norvegica]
MGEPHTEQAKIPEARLQGVQLFNDIERAKEANELNLDQALELACLRNRGDRTVGSHVVQIVAILCSPALPPFVRPPAAGLASLPKWTPIEFSSRRSPAREPDFVSSVARTGIYFNEDAFPMSQEQEWAPAIAKPTPALSNANARSQEYKTKMSVTLSWVQCLFARLLRCPGRQDAVA